MDTHAIKTCTGCNKSKSTSEFYASRGAKGGVERRCKVCRLEAESIYKIIKREAQLKEAAESRLSKNAKQVRYCRLCHLILKVNRFYHSHCLSKIGSSTIADEFIWS